MSKLRQVDLSINNGPIIRATGTCVWDILASLNYNALTFRSEGNLLTYWKWINNTKQAEPQKKARKTKEKELSIADQRRIAAWFKE
jgi:hypothetical protein